MSRICGACRRAPRVDDPLSTMFFRTRGMTSACRDCVATELGWPAPEPIRYPPGQPVPQVSDHHGIRDLPICGLCRLALREGEEAQPMRLLPEDLAEFPGVQPGCYAACPECIDLHGPAILARLMRLEIVGPTVDRIGGNFLL